MWFFVLKLGCQLFSKELSFQDHLEDARTFRICVRGTGDSIDLTAGWAETEVVKFLVVAFGVESESSPCHKVEKFSIKNQLCDGSLIDK